MTNGMKRCIVGALIGATAVATVAFGSGAAQARPTIGTTCSTSQANDIRKSSSGTWTVCANVGTRYQWVRTAPVDPTVRRAGTPCSGAYSVARTPQGKAVLCAEHRWKYQG